MTRVLRSPVIGWVVLEWVGYVLAPCLAVLSMEGRLVDDDKGTWVASAVVFGGNGHPRHVGAHARAIAHSRRAARD